MTQPSYLVFARYPEEGKVKTRLASTLGNSGSMVLYRAMMLDVIERLLKRGYPVTVCVFPPERIEEFRQLLTREKWAFPLPTLLAQQGTTLGDKMYQALAEQNYFPTLLVGTDSPTLPDSHLDTAERFMMEGTSRAVLGPAADGGFYLLGLTTLHSNYFFGDNYSNATVFHRTWASLRTCFDETLALPEWYDIDDAVALEQLYQEVQNSDLPYVRRTRAALQQLWELQK